MYGRTRPGVTRRSWKAEHAESDFFVYGKHSPGPCDYDVKRADSVTKADSTAVGIPKARRPRSAHDDTFRQSFKLKKTLPAAGDCFWGW